MKPAGFSKAWPEKPRSVSAWPGLAGLKACRLSAGRPGRLRTLGQNIRFPAFGIHMGQDIYSAHQVQGGRLGIIKPLFLFIPCLDDGFHGNVQVMVFLFARARAIYLYEKV